MIYKKNVKLKTKNNKKFKQKLQKKVKIVETKNYAKKVQSSV